MAFLGARVYLSRTLLPPDLIHRLQDVLTAHGALVYHCCDPAARSPDDFHVLFCPDSDKSRELQARGCQVVGPNCVFQCAQQLRPLPKRSCTCCFALEGIRVFVSGFDIQDKSKIERLAADAFGIVETNVSSTTDFVVAKSVLSPEYQLACSLSKPVVTLSWLETCFREHQLVSHEFHKLPPFSGLVICATQVLSAERRRISEAVKENGGLYSPDLRKDCTHLIAKHTPDGKKYDVAKAWGSVKVVNEAWLWECLSAKVCLNEDPFTVPAPVASSISAVTNATASSPNGLARGLNPVENFEELLKREEQCNEHATGEPVMGSDLYLANCRFYISGFEGEDLKRVVNLVLDGGGTRYMELNSAVSHVILGSAPHSEIKTIVKAASCGAVQLVTSSWLEECAQKGREVCVAREHIPTQILENGKVKTDSTHQKPQRAKSLNVAADDETNDSTRSFHNLSDTVGNRTSKVARGVFADLVFSFLENFHVAERHEVIGWIESGGGSVVENAQGAHYLIGPHGLCQTSPPSSVVVSIHWIRQCIQDSKLLDTRDHVIYRPLTCRVPLPGFEKLRICISKYGDSDRLICRQLCHILGAKFTEVLTKKVTHLICKDRDGEKYQVAIQYGVRVATIEWLYACIAENGVVSAENFVPCPLPCSQPALLAAVGEQSAGEQSNSQKNSSVKRKLPSKKRADALKRLATEGDSFDAWEELTASWSSGDVTLNLKGKTEESESQNGDELLRNVGRVPERPSEPFQVAEASPHQADSNIKDAAKDVATCIEGLLGQQRKAVEGNSDEDSDGTPDRSRLSDRSFECEVVSNLLNKPSGEKIFDESQLYSQVVAYDVDHCAGKHIMEKMQSTSGKLQKKVARSFLSTKKLGLGRLLEAAEANK